MAIAMELAATLAAKVPTLMPHLDERQRRLYLGSEARVLGHGGITVVARAAGVSRQVVAAGVHELEAGGQPLGRARRRGAGRKRLADIDPGLKSALLGLMEPALHGHTEPPLRWTIKSTRKLAGELSGLGHRVGADTVAKLLKEENFSLQGKATVGGVQHSDRNGQFAYINSQASDQLAVGDPVMIVDANKRKLVGGFKNVEREWRLTRKTVHDSMNKQPGSASPYEIHDVGGDSDWVTVGSDYETAEFAVATIRAWWHTVGLRAYPDARRLLIIANGSSDGYRARLWKMELARLADEADLDIAVCHLPPGTSKWNQIEHRLFSHISMNWRNRLLTRHEVIVQTVAAVGTPTGLTPAPRLDTSSHFKGIKVSDRRLRNMEKQSMRRRALQGEWNYTFAPARP